MSGEVTVDAWGTRLRLLRGTGVARTYPAGQAARGVAGEREHLTAQVEAELGVVEEALAAAVAARGGLAVRPLGLDDDGVVVRWDSEAKASSPCLVAFDRVAPLGTCVVSVGFAALPALADRHWLKDRFAAAFRAMPVRPQPGGDARLTRPEDLVLRRKRCVLHVASAIHVTPELAVAWRRRLDGFVERWEQRLVPALEGEALAGFGVVDYAQTTFGAALWPEERCFVATLQLQTAAPLGERWQSQLASRLRALVAERSADGDNKDR
jgi:hypothetical protein